MTNQHGKRVTAILPAFNEADNVDNILNELNKIKEVDEIIIVDDGSSDKTVEKACKHRDVRVIQHPYNIGNGGAIKTGIRNSTGDIIVILDLDGQHPPELIPKLINQLDKYHMVVAARSTGTESAWHRRLANRVFNLYASYVVNNRVQDLTSGFRALRIEIANEFVPLLPNTYSSPSTLTIACFRSGYTVKYEPFRSPARRGGRSGVRVIRHGLRFMLTITRMAVLFSPLRIFLPISVIISLIGGVYIIGTLMVEGRFSGFGGLVVTIGITIFTIGLISEQIAITRFMKKSR